MKNIFKKRIKLIAMIITLFMIVNVAISFSYLRGKSAGNESVSTVSLSGGSVSISYSSSTSAITADDITPGWTTSKTFTLTSQFGDGHDYFNAGFWYQINLVVNKNEFDSSSLTYSLTLSSSSDNDGYPVKNVQNVGIPTGQNLEGIVIGAGQLLNNNKSHIYTLDISYPETGVDQSHEIGCSFDAYVTIKTPQMVKIYADLDGGVMNAKGYDKVDSVFKVAVNSSIILPTPTKSGYKFDGWKITDGSGTIDGNKISVSSENVSIKALYHVLYFDFDSWSIIASNIKSGNTGIYKVGDTKEITIEGFTNTEEGSNGLYTVRISNNSNYDCTLDSKTACGFVVEFVDIIEKRQMNSTRSNVGGWPATEMYKYLNGDTSDHLTYDGTNATLYSKLPSDLRNAIIDTTVVSGHSWININSEREDGNWESTDKIYLLSRGEIYSNCTTEDCHDTASYPSGGNGATTRQLDYYSNKSVSTSSNRTYAVKNFNGTAAWWWQRAAYSSTQCDFLDVYSDGSWNYCAASDNTGGGVAPAFRIG